MSANSETTARQSRPLTGKPWVDMDYGPFLTASIDCGQPRTNLAYKGIAIRLAEAFGGRQDEAVVFDTDLLRYAAGWTGDYVALKGVVFDGEHWAYPQISGRQVFGNPMQPGWAKAGTFEDPRAHPFGPLPRDWARWRGLYLQGNRVVLSYSVGGTEVLELPGLETRGGLTAFSRSFQRGPAAEVQDLQLAFEPDHDLRLLAPQTLAPATGLWSADRVIAILEPSAPDRSAEDPPASALDAGLLGRWEFDRFAGDAALAEAASAGALELRGAKPGQDGHVGGGLAFGERSQAEWRGGPPIEFLDTDLSIAVWVRAMGDGTIFAQAPAAGNWVPDGKALFLRGGRLTFDVGWVGAVASSRAISDGKWHHVALTWSHADGAVGLFVDGEPDGSGILKPRTPVHGHELRLGFAAPNFPETPWFNGTMDGLRFYARRLSPPEVAALAGVERRSGILAAAVIGTPEGAAWLPAEGGNLRLRLPPAAGSSRFKVLLWRGSKEGLRDFAALVGQSTAPEDLTPLTQGGPARWPERLVARGQPGTDEGPYAIETLTAPDDNPWHSWLRFGGLDFFADGRRAAVCTWNGDVWTVDGVDGDLTRLTWQRIATGLFQPLGLKIVRDQIYVLGRDQITRLHDLNGDGEADWYENFNNDCMVSEHFHEFALDLKTDRDGNFYYIKCARHALPALHPHHGTLLKLPPDGSRLEVVARGLRAVNGLGVGPNGELTCVDNQGHWMPANRINWIRPGGWYGNQWAWNPEGRTTYDEPLCWVHNFVDRSGGTHVWVPDDRWGPLDGQMITISYGMGHIFLVLSEEVEGVRQGGVTRFPLEFETGVMRGVFHPGNGQLYTAGLYGWAGNKTRPGGLYRVRYTGRPLHLPNALHVARDGVVVGFTEPLDAASATDPGNYDVTIWNYLWTANYGSPDLKPNGQEGRERLSVESATLSADRRSVFLRLPGLQRVMQMHVVFKLRAADGTAFDNFIHHTVHRLGSQPGLELLGSGAIARTGTEEVQARNASPGLVQQVEKLADGGAASGAGPLDTRRARLPALSVAAGTPPTPFLAPGAFRSVWRGYLRLDLNDERSFQFQGRGAARLRLNGETVFEVTGPELSGAVSPAVPLRRGPNRFELVYESPLEGDSVLRLFWSARGQPPEPVSPVDFLCEADDPALVRGEALRRGRSLFLRHQCVKCHQPAGDAAALLVPESAQDAPALDGVGMRLNAAWMAKYLAYPPAARDDVLMPRLLRGDGAEVEAAARDLSAFLATLRVASSAEGARTATSAAPLASGPAAEVLPGDAAQGKAHFDRLGCGACHLLAGEARLTNDTRISLSHVPAKWQASALSRFLEQPARDHVWTRMPDFALNPAEATTLASYLLAQGPAAASPEEIRGAGNAERGRDLLATSGCLGCHTAKGLTNRLASPSLVALAASDWQHGCLADDPVHRGRAPDFGFPATARSDLRGFARLDGIASLQRETPAEFAERQVANLRCGSCHARDGEPDFWSRLTAARMPPVKNVYEDEEDSAAATVHLGRPELTLAGEKLHGEWMQRLLTGRLGYKPRPESQGRMPSFAAVGPLLAEGLARQHGLDAAPFARPTANPVQAMAGQRLILIEGGFGCVSCHPVGRQAALAGPDTATINFAFVADRLRLEYFQRYVRDPQRFRPGTMMPTFIAEDGSTPIKAVLDGDATRQFEAIWNYLLSLSPKLAQP